jgi:cysteine desulfurase
MKAIYLDHNATTGLDPLVRQEMLPWLNGRYGNPSSIHSFGQEARRAVDKARARVARLVGAQPEEIIFTSGGTEANNLAIFGAVAGARSSLPHLVTSSIEHQAVLNPCRELEKRDAFVTYLPVDRQGLLNIADASAQLHKGTVLTTVMLANNDTGVLQPVAGLSQRARECGIVLHTDAVQAVGKIPINVKTLGVDLLSFSGHKLYGPQGIGALYIRQGTHVLPRTFGGYQEHGLRPGTENVTAIVGFGKACELVVERMLDDSARMEAIRSFFEAEILERIPGVTVNGEGAPRLPNTSNLSFEGLDGEALVINLDLLGLAVSTGSACSSGEGKPSHVLMAMGRTPVQALSSVRFSFGRGNTPEDAVRAISLIVQAVEGVRGGRR